jgi:hypothetical protein
VTRNVLSGNCAGILVLGDAPGPAGRWRIDHNRIVANNKVCPGDPEEGEPGLSGLGIGLSGVRNTTISRNTVLRNRPGGRTLASGGLVVVRSDERPRTTPRRILVNRNVFRNNAPLDVRWDQTGQARFPNNRCGDSSPGAICG